MALNLASFVVAGARSRREDRIMQHLVYAKLHPFLPLHCLLELLHQLPDLLLPGGEVPQGLDGNLRVLVVLL